MGNKDTQHYATNQQHVVFARVYRTRGAWQSGKMVGSGDLAHANIEAEMVKTGNDKKVRKARSENEEKVLNA